MLCKITSVFTIFRACCSYVLRPIIDTCNIQLGVALQLYSDWLSVIGFKVLGQSVFHSARPHSPRKQYRQLRKLLLSKSIIRRFDDSRYSFFTACVVYRIVVPFLSSIRVHFIKRSNKHHSPYIDFAAIAD